MSGIHFGNGCSAYYVLKSSKPNLSLCTQYKVTENCASTYRSSQNSFNTFGGTVYIRRRTSMKRCDSINTTTRGRSRSIDTDCMPWFYLIHGLKQCAPGGAKKPRMTRLMFETC